MVGRRMDAGAGDGKRTADRTRSPGDCGACLFDQRWAKIWQGKRDRRIQHEPRQSPLPLLAASYFTEVSSLL